MFRFALARVRQTEVAEDLVQDALVAALRNHHKFQGKSEEGTWLISILKHKVVDYLRQRDRERPLLENADGDSNCLADTYPHGDGVPPGKYKVTLSLSAGVPEELLKYTKPDTTTLEIEIGADGDEAIAFVLPEKMPKRIRPAGPPNLAR